MPISPPARLQLERRLDAHRKHRWPTLTQLTVTYRGNHAYVAGVADGDTLKLCRLAHHHADDWGFAIYLASGDRYEPSILPTGSFTGTPEQALDCACGLYLNDITAWADDLIADPADTRENI